MIDVHVGDDNFLRVDGASPALKHQLRSMGSRTVGGIPRLPDLTFIREKLEALGDVHFVDHRASPIRFPLPLSDQLYDFQIDAANFLRYSHYPGGLLSLRPGLGKTLISLVAAEPFDRVLVLCPRPLVETWRRESADWLGRDLVENASSGWSITTLETLQTRWELFSKHRWDAIILDESARIRNRRAKRTKAVWEIRRDARLLWALSGLPVVANAADLWAQLKALWPVAFSSFWRFVDDFCLYEETVWGKSIYGSKPIDLSQAFRELIFKEPEDVSGLVPHYLPEVVEVPLSSAQQTAFNSMRDHFVIMLERGDIDASTKLTQLLRLQQVVSTMRTLDSSREESSKIDRLVDLVTQHQLGTPCLIWYHWRETGQQIYERLLPIVGEENIAKLDEDRDQTIERFQRGNLRFLIASLNIGQYGLSFTKTQSVVYIDRTFDLEKLVQSLYRPRRLGLLHQPRLITLTSPGTTDDLVQAASEGKMATASKLAESELLKVLKGMARS